MYDVYLGGAATPEWRANFKSQISSDISIFDPYLKTFDKTCNDSHAEQVAREFYFMDQCQVIIFHLNSSESFKSARLQIGDCVGHDKQVIVCIEKNVQGSNYLNRYCEYRGVLVAKTLDELITTAESCCAEIELCNFDEDE